MIGVFQMARKSKEYWISASMFEEDAIMITSTKLGHSNLIIHRKRSNLRKNPMAICDCLTNDFVSLK